MEERLADEPEPGERRGLRPVGRFDGEVPLEASVTEDDYHELCVGVRVRPQHDDDAVTERFGKLDLRERCEASDSPAPHHTAWPDESYARFVAFALGDDLPAARDCASRAS